SDPPDVRPHHRHRRRPHRRRRSACRNPRADEQGSGIMIPELHIRQGGATPAEAPWADADAKSLRLVLLGLALLAAAILFAASNDRLSRFVEGVVADWTADPVATTRAAKQKAIAKLIAETGTDAIAPVAEGADAVARNALLPVSTLPVEAARPFVMPVISLAQSTNAQRCLTQAIYYEAA